MRTLIVSSVLALAALLAGAASSKHGGGLNACGCHFDRRTDTCHCHHDGGCGCECEPDRCSD